MIDLIVRECPDRSVLSFLLPLQPVSGGPGDRLASAWVRQKEQEKKKGQEQEQEQEQEQDRYGKRL